MQGGSFRVRHEIVDPRGNRWAYTDGNGEYWTDIGVMGDGNAHRAGYDAESDMLWLRTLWPDRTASFLVFPLDGRPGWGGVGHLVDPRGNVWSNRDPLGNYWTELDTAPHGHRYRIGYSPHDDELWLEVMTPYGGEEIAAWRYPEIRSTLAA